MTMHWLYSPRPPQSAHRALSLLWVSKCERCCGAGWFAEVVPGTENDFAPDYNERYCDCEAGRWRRIADGWTDEQLAEWYVERLAALEVPAA